MEPLRHKLVRVVKDAAQRAIEAGALPSVGLPEVTVEHPQNPDHGDYACNIGLRMARSAQMNPLEIARHVTEHMSDVDELGATSVAPPGFINMTISDAWLKQQVETVLAEGQTFGNIDKGSGRRVQVEFVSVNPTGPVHIGHARGAVLGSTLANVLTAAGYQVEREYYINDAGNQMDSFYRSLYARAAQSLGLEIPMPADGYMGDYVTETAEAILAESPDRAALEALVRNDADAATRVMGQAGLAKMLDLIRDDLAMLNVEFDVWFNEQSLFDSGQYDEAIRRLRDDGYLVEREGATWFTHTSLDDDKGSVVVRSNGAPTYFASDVAYHYDKFLRRKFDHVIDVWGADHQGHVPRMKSAVEALGIDPQRLTILIAQLVTLRRGDEVIRLSKRTGDIITVREVVDEVGSDVCRFFLLSRSADSQMDFDLELAKNESEENPVFYVQYAYARIAGIRQRAADRGFDPDLSRGDVSLLGHEAELALVRKMLLLTEIVEMVAVSYEPHHLPHYAQELATAFHSFYKQCDVLPDRDPNLPPELTAARLKLVEAARIVLARTLDLMGMSAPERM